MRTQIIALIPARRGSKGLSGKNMARINGKPLIAFTIDAAIEAAVFSQIVVSTNDHDVTKIANQRGITLLERPDNISDDLATADSVIAHAIEAITLPEDSIIIYLQPTSPLRNAAHIKNALDIFLKKCPRAMVSVKVASSSIFKAYKLEKNGSLTGLFGPGAPYCARQQIPPLFLPNGAIYIFKVVDFLQSNRQIPRSEVLPFVMDNTVSLDIDTAEDLTLAREMFSSHE